MKTVSQEHKDMIFLLDSHLETGFQVKPIKSPATVFAEFNQRHTVLAIAGVEAVSVFSDASSKDIRFESRKGYDYLVLHLPFLKRNLALPPVIEIYMTGNFLFVFGDADVVKAFAREVNTPDNNVKAPADVLLMLFGYVLRQDGDLLEAIDDSIEKLEERTTLKKPEDHSATIIALRKQLLALKHYFGSLYDLLEELEDNRNNLFTQTQLQAFRVHKNKANRLLNTVLNLRDYLTQVREAFQNQLDISLNDTMRFFTVITAIFLPLTLLVGWYGMNLHMPELASKITYPLIIVVSLVFIVVSLVFCKKKGWF